MPTTKLATRTKWIKRLKSYKNNDPRCSYPWELGNLGYCWGYASWLDGKNGDKSIFGWGDYSMYKEYIEFCRKDCKYWKGK